MEEDGSGRGLREQQKKAKIAKEFKNHPDNPFNQLTARYNTTKEEMELLKEANRSAIETRLAAKDKD